MTEPSDSKLRSPLLRSTCSWTVATATTAMLCIAALTLWSAIDASFGMATWKAKVRLGIERIESTNPEMAKHLGIVDAMKAIKWDSLGKRVVVLYALYGIGIASSVALGVLATKHVSLKRTIAFCCVLVIWVGLLTTRTAVDEWRTRRQVASILPRFEQAAAALSEEWPTQSGVVPPGIKFLVSTERYPDVLIVRGNREPYPFHEDFGLRITRGPEGIIRFDLAGTADACVEYHPNGTLPSVYTSGFGSPSPPVASASKLKNDWYLVRYSGS